LACGNLSASIVAIASVDAKFFPVDVGRSIEQAAEIAIDFSRIQFDLIASGFGQNTKTIVDQFDSPIVCLPNTKILIRNTTYSKAGSVPNKLSGANIRTEPFVLKVDTPIRAVG